MTDREMEILELVAEGMSNPDVANQLYISKITVRNHVSNILEKLSAKNRTQAVVKSFRKGIIEL